MKTSLTPEFTFAGFSWPRYYAILPRGPMAKRLERKKHPVCGNYYGKPLPITKSAELLQSFYLDSDFQPGLRWQWADEVEGARIRHAGWFTDEHGDGDKIRGIVMRLPHGRGFLAGWSMGESMASCVDYSWVIESERDAAHAADSMAERVAEAERERSQNQDSD